VKDFKFLYTETVETNKQTNRSAFNHNCILIQFLLLSKTCYTFRPFHKAFIRHRPKNTQPASEQALYVSICLVTHDNGMSHPKEAVEFLDGESAVLKAHTITSHGQAEVTAIGNAPALV
jgi:hypothetical protein